ncbi:MAG TPA: apolipoprotein N-acyltransferase [Methylomirabilota bacterium]|nr:apolipoprotein N-acyltransferase [Methylomirabilota bacterium]
MKDRLGQTLLLLGSAFVLALAFPRTDWEAAAWFTLTPLFVVALRSRPRIAFAWGWLYGLTFFLVLLRWLDYTFRTYSAIPWPLTWAPLFLLAAWCGMFVAIVSGLLSLVAHRGSPGWALLIAPCLWVGAEWVRGHLFGGFPWGTLGYSQYLRLPIIQVAELGGVHAVSFTLVAVNAALAGALLLSWGRAMTGLGLAGALIAAVLGFGHSRLAGPPRPAEAQIALMQPAIEQPLKWDPNHAAVTLRIYLELTRQAAAGRPDLIVWPETAAPAPIRRDAGLLATLQRLAGQLGVPLLIGSIDVEDGRPPKLRNTAFLVDERGIRERYDKIHLVPFGEYVPLSGVIGFVRGWAEFIAELEPGTRAVVFAGPPAPFGIVICYEGIFPDLFREFVNDGARVMVNMTNDGWFGRTSGPAQHLTMYPLRAVEHRIAVVRAANTGVSAFIAPTGQIVRHLGLFDRGVLTDRVPLRDGRTLFTRLGDWVAWLSLAVSAAAVGAALRRRSAEC